MISAESIARRHEKAVKAEKEEFDREIAAGLLQLHYKGKCACGLMLTEQDQERNRTTYRCPHCGKSRIELPLTAAEPALAGPAA